MFPNLAQGLLAACLLVLAAQAQEPKSASDTVKLSLPDENWSLVLNLPGFSVEEDEVQLDGRRYLFAQNLATGVILSAYLEKVKTPADMAGCQASLEARAKASTSKKMGESIFDLNGMKVLEYLVPEFDGRRVRQKNFFVCIPKEDVFVNIHLLKVAWQLGQEKLFAAILANLRFEENTRASGTP